MGFELLYWEDINKKLLKLKCNIDTKTSQHSRIEKPGNIGEDWLKSLSCLLVPLMDLFDMANLRGRLIRLFWKGTQVISLKAAIYQK